MEPNNNGDELAFEVRDCECDLQGIVNNAVYQNYLEHARHKFLKAGGADFAALTAAGVHLVVARAELDYRAPLRSGDAFVVASRIERPSPVRVVFVQDVLKMPARQLMVRSQFVCAAMNRQGRPIVQHELQETFDRMERLTGL